MRENLLGEEIEKAGVTYGCGRTSYMDVKMVYSTVGNLNWREK